MKKYIILTLLAALFSSCEDMFDPAIENIRDLEVMYEEPIYAQGVLLNAYLLMSMPSSPNSDYATDDATANQSTNNYVTMASGTWSAISNPLSRWVNGLNAIQQINTFMKCCYQVPWSADENISLMFSDRLMGEAYALRALHLYQLLKAHGGRSDSGELLGVPIVLDIESASSDFNYTRDSYQACVEQIFSDAEKAIELLPLDYITHTEIPQKYADLGVTNITDYDRVNGADFGGRISGRIVEAIVAKTALMAASPAYSEGTEVDWAAAAAAAAVVLDRIGGVQGLDATGGTWYANIDEINALGAGATPAEIIWRGNISSSNSLETNNFPPSLYGKGLTNPSQNLVDAFPMLNGYPIDAVEANYSDQTMYENRDPRLEKYILVNGALQGPSDSQITTGIYSTNLDGLNKEIGSSTSTGYYLRKHLQSGCNPNPTYNTTQNHYNAYIRYTDIFLSYAEAANEAYGPTGGEAAYSAYDVIKAIRSRAGIGLDNGDAYLESCKSDKDAMRELIRQERRLELCFENVRFWDLRRWLSDLNTSVEGVSISANGDGSLSYQRITVAKRDFKEWMHYGPIPNSEILKWSNLEQNRGW